MVKRTGNFKKGIPVDRLSKEELIYLRKEREIHGNWTKQQMR